MRVRRDVSHTFFIFFPMDTQQSKQRSVAYRPCVLARPPVTFRPAFPLAPTPTPPLPFPAFICEGYDGKSERNSRPRPNPPLPPFFFLGKKRTES